MGCRKQGVISTQFHENDKLIEPCHSQEEELTAINAFNMFFRQT